MIATEEVEVLEKNPINRRINGLILLLSFTSLAAAIVPLWPRIGAILPIDSLDRRSAMSLYSGFLLVFMGVIFPLFAAPGCGRRGRLTWWWVGGYALAFSGLPLFVLAYIAGVQFRGVILVLLWSGAVGVGAIGLQEVVGERRRGIVPLLSVVLLVVLPSLGSIGRTLGLASLRLSPMTTVMAVTRDFEEPELILPGALYVAFSLALWFRGRPPRIPVRVPLLILAVLSVLVAAAAPHQSARVRWWSLTGGRVVQGRSFPILVDADPGTTVEVEIGRRERWLVEASATGLGLLLPVPTRADDAVRVRAGGRDIDAPLRLIFDDSPRGLALVVGTAAPAGGPREELMRLGGDPIEVEPERLPAVAAAYEAFAAILVEDATFRGFSAPLREAILAATRTGVSLLLLHAEADGVTASGAGRIHRSRSTVIPADLALHSRARRSRDANLQSTFDLPDWGRVDLGALVTFLGVYHLVFYLIFLLPMLLDSRKSVGVYLVSVGFVLSLELVGGWYAMKELFLRDTQILQQNVQVAVLGDCEGRPVLDFTEVSCFASFNGQPGSVSFDLDDAPVFLAGDEEMGPGDIRVDTAGRRLAVESMRLDRFRRKQLVRSSRTLSSPWRAQVRDGKVRLEIIPGVDDPRGFLTAKRLAAFARRSGRLHRVDMQASELGIAADSDPRSWAGVLANLDSRDEVVPFLGHVLGRFTVPSRDVLVLLLEGLRPLHFDPEYLLSRDILQVLIVPL